MEKQNHREMRNCGIGDEEAYPRRVNVRNKDWARCDSRRRSCVLRWRERKTERTKSVIPKQATNGERDEIPAFLTNKRRSDNTNRAVGVVCGGWVVFRFDLRWWLTNIGKKLTLFSHGKTEE